MGRSSVRLLSWILAASFILATVLLYVDRLNLVATPPDLPNANMVERVLGSAQYRQAIWPVFLWTNLLFAVGFVATVAFSAAVRSRVGGTGALPVFGALAVTGGVLGAVSSIIPLGSVNAAVWLGYCDCGFKETEIVSQVWAQMIAQDVGDWIGRGAFVVLAVSLLFLLREAGALISSRLWLWTAATAIVLLLVPFIGTTELLPETAGDILTTVAAVVLVPVWAIWLGRTVDGRPASALG